MQAKEKAAAAKKEKAAAEAKKAAADKAAEEANKADKAAAEPVHIGGATGSNAENINGIYDPTCELSSGRRVYKRRDTDIWIELFGGKWQVKPASAKGKDNGWAFFAASRALEQCGDSTWQVYDSKAWARQASVKLMPESRAAFELVHRPTRHMFTSSYAHIDLHDGVQCAYVSPDFRTVFLTQYYRPTIRLRIENQRCVELKSKLGGIYGAGWFFPSGNYFKVEEENEPFECSTGNKVTCTVSVEDSRRLKNRGNLCGISPDDKFAFYAHGGGEDRTPGTVFQVWELTGKFLWEFNLPKTIFVVCLPDNDTFIVHHSRSLSKYSLSSRTCLLSVDCGDLLSQFRDVCCNCWRDVTIASSHGGYAKYSQDGRWASFCNVVVNVRSLQATLLPLRKVESSTSRVGQTVEHILERHFDLISPPVFFLPGSQTAIYDKQVFSLAGDNWTLRLSPRPNALPFLPDDGIFDGSPLIGQGCHYVAYNLVTRASGSDVFFGNLSFAFATKASFTSVSVHLQD
jgi:hypothetical protein